MTPERDVLVTGEQHGERWYAHPWCARWTVPLAAPLAEDECRGCGHRYPVREDGAHA